MIDDPADRAAAAARYPGNGQITSGENIDRALGYVLGAIVLGILAEIALARQNLATLPPP